MKKAPRNKTLTLSKQERHRLAMEFLTLSKKASLEEVIDRIINQDALVALDLLPNQSVDLVFADPPYNLTKTFNLNSFKQLSLEAYEKWLDSWLNKIPRILKPTGSIYLCGDWRSSAAIHRVLEKYFIVRNRITFEREKGRGAKANWKTASEDIWFATVSDDYYFDVDAVKIKRRVIAPYRINGVPKDWMEEDQGNYRLTHPSNFWTDITIPFWSMAENTPHPTQKSEKLLAKIIMASSKRGDIILDPFAGVGTTGVVARKLERHFVMIEIEREYCCYAQKRLHLAQHDVSIQGYSEGVFWERNASEGIRTKGKATRNQQSELNFFLNQEVR